MLTAHDYILEHVAVQSGDGRVVALIHLTQIMPSDCYAFQIGRHRRTVVRTTKPLKHPTVKTVLAAMAADYDAHIAGLVLNAHREWVAQEAAVHMARAAGGCLSPRQAAIVAMAGDYKAYIRGLVQRAGTVR